MLTHLFNPNELWEPPELPDFPTTAVINDDPRLLWLYRLAVRCGITLDHRLETIAALKWSLKQRGVTESGWRMLCEARQADVYALLGHPNISHHWNDLADWIAFHTTCGLNRLYPAPVATVLLNQVIYRLDTALQIRPLASLYPRSMFIALSIEAIERGKVDDLSSLATCELPRVIAWCDNTSGKDRAMPKKPRWAAMLRAASHWENREAMRLKADTEYWHSALHGLRLENCNIVALDDAYLVWKEGMEMKHCLARMTSLAIGGTSRFFSVRDTLDPGRKATLELQADDQGRWYLYDMRGPCNQAVDTDMRQIGWQVAFAYNARVQGGVDPEDCNGACFLLEQFGYFVRRYVRRYGYVPCWLGNLEFDEAARLLRQAITYRFPLPSDDNYYSGIEV